MYHYSILFNKTGLRAFALLVAFALAFSPLMTSLAAAEEIPEETIVEEVETQPEEIIVEEEQEVKEQEETVQENDGEDGADSGSDETTNPEIVVTGDALAGAETETVANFNEASVETSSSTEETNDENNDASAQSTQQEVFDTETGTSTATSTEEQDNGDDIDAALDAELPEGTPGLPGNTTSSTTNDAEIDNSASVGASTGDNEVGDGGVIATGDAFAYANVVNLANTNIFNSEGLIAFFSQAFGISSIDLRDAFSSIFATTQNAVSTPVCGYEICTGGNANLAINNMNNATITNDVNVVANTGGNTAGDGGTIYTGDAYAAANIFNLANTNITDSSYLLLSFNNFGDYAGDILLPNGQLLDALFGANGTSYSNLSSSNTNNADVSNNMSVGAETGDNESGGGGLIVTGDATANGTVQNTVNTNLFGGSDLVIVLRVHGDWDGEIFGLPTGIEWTETDGGIVLYSTGDGTASPSSVGDLSVENTNNATINNNVSVFALTGDNKVGDDGTVVTGDAHASANVTNVANTNILGQNWALLVFDIFGNWSGNLAFGQPNLWIGAKATPKSSPVMPGTEVEYTFTVTNQGDSIASDVVLDNFFKQNELAFQNLKNELESEGDAMKASWEVGDLRPGETKNLSFTAQIGSSLPKNAAIPVSLEASVYARENDANDTDNHESITVYSGENPSEIRGSKISFPANVEVSKTSSSNTVEPGSSVDYTVTIENHGGPLFRSMLRDVLTYEDGEMISEQYWELGTILTDELITIEYTMEFGTDMKSGTYTNKADAVGLEQEKSWLRGVSYESPAAAHTITLGGAPEVLGISTDMCPPYLNTFMKAGVRNNSEEVLKLQKFLNNHTGSSIAETGFFGFETEVAVKHFQTQYADDILSPWGMNDPSGYVYLTTRKKVNEIACEYSREFPLSSGQKAEIQKFRIGVEVIPEDSTSPLPLFGEAEDESEDDITLGDEAEAIKNEVAIAEEKKPEEPLPPNDDEETHPFVISVLKAINWFRDLTPIANAFSE